MATPGRDQDWGSVGPLFMVGIPGPRLDKTARELVRELRVGGVILFARNIESPEQVWELTRDLQREALAVGDLPLLIAVDQEGGVVQRLKEPFTRIPAARDLGTGSTPAEVTALSRTVARELALVGINLDLAPVLDVARQPNCPQWGRSYSSDPEQVAIFGEAAIRGFLEGGILPAAKHFPGLGDTSVDSHQVLPRAQDSDPARSTDLLPFRRAVAAGVPVIMTAHVHVPAWDDQTATMSSVALREWLRERLDFKGVIITDDLEMGAIAGAAAVPIAARQALMAGADLLLICSEVKYVWEAAALLKEDQSLQQHLADSKRRLADLRQQVAREPVSLEEVKAHFTGQG